MSADITSELSNVLRTARTINPNLTSPLRMKIGVMLAPAWTHPTANLIDTTSYAEPGGWSTSTSWTNYDRLVEVYTAKDASNPGVHDIMLPYLHVVYTVI